MSADAETFSGYWRVACAGRSHRGNFRKHNEDSIQLVGLGGEAAVQSGDSFAWTGDSRSGVLAVVCDGVGGENAGEVASRRAIDGFTHSLLHPSKDRMADDWRNRLLDCVFAAHQNVVSYSREHPESEGMGTTLTGVLIARQMAWIAHIGDSRVYRWRRGELRQISADHSLVGHQLREGLLTEEEARRHPLRNILDKVLGGNATSPEPDIVHVELNDGDILVVCSDGLTDSLRDKDITRILHDGHGKPVDLITAAMLQAALDTSGRDNISICLIELSAPKRSLLGRLFS